MSPLRLPDLRNRSLPGGSGSSASALGDDAGFPVFDLLREPRQDLGQHPIAPILGDRRRLLLQGTTVGAVVLGVVLGLSALVFLRHQVVKAQMGSLNEVEAQYAALQAELANRNKQMAAIVEVNRQLAGALSNVRPTSALLSELQLRTPDGVQLLGAGAGSDNLTLRGVAIDPMAFARINALQLELRRSPLLDPLGISLSRLERKVEANAPANAVSPVQFEVTARFTQLPAAKMAQALQQLGSEGMSRRLQLLQREGMLP
ncbi:MAG: PilN domain-containing protein [Cyanobium sp.]